VKPGDLVTNFNRNLEIAWTNKNMIMRQIVVLFIVSLTCFFASAQKHPGWIKHAVFYQIYPSSFQVMDSNGIGDLKGIQSRLDYIQSIGVNTIWLNPIFKSAFKDKANKTLKEN
jgi:hypothetical protein